MNRTLLLTCALALAGLSATSLSTEAASARVGSRGASAGAALDAGPKEVRG